MLVIFDVAFLIVTIGLALGLDEQLSYMHCKQQCTTHYCVGDYCDSSGLENCALGCDGAYLALAGWIILVFGIICCYVACCIAVGYAMAH